MTRKTPHTDTHARIRQAAADMADIATMWHRYINAMNDYSPGIRSTLGSTGSRGSGVSDPTAGTVTAGERLEPGKPLDEAEHRGWRTDPLLATHTKILTDLAVITSMIEQTRRSMRMHTYPATTARAVRVCANLSCTTIIETPGSDLSIDDRCPPCKRYFAEHDRDAPVRVIADRERKRAAEPEVSA